MIDRSLTDRRFHTLVAGTFGLLALLLATVGIYGVISYSVRQRTREIGVRIALGAQARDILGMIVRRGLWLTSLGVGLGLVGALALTRFLSGLLYGVGPTDPWTFLAIPLLLIGVSALACLVPARRAARVEPVTALRCE